MLFYLFLLIINDKRFINLSSFTYPAEIFLKSFAILFVPSIGPLVSLISLTALKEFKIY